MASTDIPTQYQFLFCLLRESSKQFAEQAEEMMKEHGVPFNLGTLRFEIDAYLTFLLSCSLLNLKHDRQVWEDMCNLCEVVLSKIHEQSLTNEDLADVIVARIQQYGDIANRCASSGDPPQISWLKALRQNIMASAHQNRVAAGHPLIIGDIFQEHSILLGLVAIDLMCAGRFGCALKHMFQRTNNVRTLSEGELAKLACAGAKEGAEIAEESIMRMNNREGKQD